MTILTFLLLLLLNRVDCIYKGVFIGTLPSLAHGTKGDVYAADEDLIYIDNFYYDGAAPAAFVWGGKTQTPDGAGFIIPDYFGTDGRLLKEYKNVTLLHRMPKGMKIKDIKYISIWCRIYTTSFGHVSIKADFQPPKALNLGKLNTLAHEVKAESVVFKNIRTIELKGFHFDGSTPGTFFLAGTGDKPSTSGTKIPDENGNVKPLKAYTGQDITIRMPMNISIQTIDWISVYCLVVAADFGSIHIQKSAKELVPADPRDLGSEVNTFPNCETVFEDLLQVSWKVTVSEIVFKLEGFYNPDQYFAFGLSGSTTANQMVGADVAVAFYDSANSVAVVQDYHLSAKAQCNQVSQSGACPDSKIKGGKEDTELLSFEYKNQILSVIYKKRFDTDDNKTDLAIDPDTPHIVVAAIGPLNSFKETAFHFVKFTQASATPIKLTFSRGSKMNCKKFNTSEEDDAEKKIWKIPEIRDVTTFRAQIGANGGTRGYTGITGIQGWGIAWWINELLIPKIHVKRGVTYKFIVEGGTNKDNLAEYHPFYITNSKIGGGEQFQKELGTEKHKIYAGVTLLSNGSADVSSAIGRYCEWKHASGVDKALSSATFADYKNTLKLTCAEGKPGEFEWTPDKDTPDLVYYQCFTHRNLGWEIVVSSSRVFTASPVLLLIFFFCSRLYDYLFK